MKPTLYLDSLSKFKGYLKRTGWQITLKADLPDYQAIRAFHPEKKKWFIAFEKKTTMRLTIQDSMLWVIEEFEAEQEKKSPS